MPDRDYYLQSGERMDNTRAAYRSHITAVLKLGSIADGDAKAGRIVDLERRIARVHATRTESADVSKGNNPWPREEFSRRAPGLDWPALFRSARLDQAPTIIVWHPQAVAGIAQLVTDVPIDVWRDYLTFHAIDRRASVLPKAFADESFAFYGKVLSGTPQQQERWKRAVDNTNAELGDAVGKIDVQRHFPAAQKAQLQRMVGAIIAAFDRRLDALPWMTPKTKAAAKAKLTTLRVGIGYPDTWRDFSALSIVRGDASQPRSSSRRSTTPPRTRPRGSAQSARSSATRSATASTIRAASSTRRAASTTGGPPTIWCTSSKPPQRWSHSTTPTCRSPTCTSTVS
jgi:putative endopeptidase